MAEEPLDFVLLQLSKVSGVRFCATEYEYRSLSFLCDLSGALDPILVDCVPLAGAREPGALGVVPYLPADCALPVIALLFALHACTLALDCCHRELRRSLTTACATGRSATSAQLAHALKKMCNFKHFVLGRSRRFRETDRDVELGCCRKLQRPQRYTRTR